MTRVLVLATAHVPQVMLVVGIVIMNLVPLLPEYVQGGCGTQLDGTRVPYLYHTLMIFVHNDAQACPYLVLLYLYNIPLCDMLFTMLIVSFTIIVHASICVGKARNIKKQQETTRPDTGATDRDRSQR